MIALTAAFAVDSASALLLSSTADCPASQADAADFSANPLVLDDASAGCTLRWTSVDDPAPQNAITLVYGRPGEAVELAREPITFTRAADGKYVAERRFARQELGSQSFVTVVLSGKEDVLLWTAWTVRGRDATAEPPPAAYRSLDIRLGSLHLQNAHGRFPRARQAEGIVWQAVGEETRSHDLDGGETGSPGIHVSVSDAWTPEDVAPASLVEQLRQRAQSAVALTQHAISIGDLEWTETADELLKYEDATEHFERRHYYSIITVWTDASYRPLGQSAPKRFIHETSANLGKPQSALEWASYVRGEYTADPQLLRIIERYTQRGRAIPGFSHMPLARAGDAGPSEFGLRFIVRLRPWAPRGDEPDPSGRFKAGIESFSVVGSRAGTGTAALVSDAEERSAWCRAFGLFCATGEPRQPALPTGWFREGSSAHLRDARGNIPIVQSPPQVAHYYAANSVSNAEISELVEQQYGSVLKSDGTLRPTQEGRIFADVLGNALAVPDELAVLRLSQLPSKAYFVLGASFRAGALVRRDGLIFPSYRMIPANAYVQYVVRTSVIKDLATVLTGAPTREVQEPVELGEDEAPRAPPGIVARLLQWLADLPFWLRALLILVPAMLLMWIIAPLRPILIALGKLLGTIIDLIGDLLRAVFGRGRK